jgi:phenylacetyl-CoA:acceptor oxidoreductase 26-kDa subunit
MSAPQRYWDARAAANFILGGAGSGLVACSVLLPDRLPAYVGLALVAAGLGAVWLEIGRKLRAAHVFFNPFTSWMTRESLAALMLFPLGVFYPLLAAPVALAFLYCQARILRAAKGIPAWRAPQVVALVVSTGLAEGAGLALCFSTERSLIGVFVLAVALRYLAWRRYRATVKSAALEPAGKALAWIGTVAALALLPAAAPLAGLAAAASGAWLKLALVTRASFKQGFSLPHLPVRGAR